MRARDFRQNSARDGGTSGRPAGKENPMPASATIAIDQEARDKALQWVGGLTENIGQVENSLALLSGFVGDDHPLAAAVVGAIGISATEMRQQLPALKQAIRDIPLLNGESS
jgi:hypothetical protein